MTEEQKAAYIYSQSVAAMCEVEAMKAENHQRCCEGQSQAYDSQAFLLIIYRYGLDCNTVLGWFAD